MYQTRPIIKYDVRWVLSNLLYKYFQALYLSIVGSLSVLIVLMDLTNTSSIDLKTSLACNYDDVVFLDTGLKSKW